MWIWIGWKWRRFKNIPFTVWHQPWSPQWQRRAVKKIIMENIVLEFFRNLLDVDADNGSANLNH